MTASRRNTPPSSRSPYGETDFAKVDAHEITDEMVARGVPGDGLELLKRGRGRPPSDSPKQQVTMRLDADVLAAMRATGPGWQVRANDALRQRFKA